MKLLGLTEIVKTVFNFLDKTSKSGEKEQELQEKKVDIYKRTIVIVVLGLFFLIALDTLFPKIEAGDWIYNLFERLIIYMTE